jgi:DNA-binding transcriptional regulator YiaG
MPNIASMLKSEIVRLARKELRSELAQVRKQLATHRTALAALRRQLAETNKATKRNASVARSVARPTNTDPASMRFSAKGTKSLRAKLGLSAADFGRLAGVSGNTVFNWETGKAKPQRAQLEALASLRGLGKRAAAAKLEALRT